MKKAFYDGLAVYADEESIEDTKGAYISTGQCPSKSRWIEKSELASPEDHPEQTIKTIIVRTRFMSARVPLSEVEFYEEDK